MCAVPEANVEGVDSSPNIQENEDDVRRGLERAVGAAVVGVRLLGGERSWVLSLLSGGFGAEEAGGG